MIHYTTRLREPENIREEALLDLVATSEIIRKIGDRFFKDYGLTRAQFNILVLLREAGDGGLAQVQIGREMIVTAANVSNHMERLERAGLIAREQKDRRTNRVVLQPKAKKLLGRIDKEYFARIDQVMGVLTEKENKQLSTLLAKLRAGLGR